MKIKYEPRQHQLKAINKLKDNDKYGLFLDMGLGKTFIVLYTWHHNHSNNLLIIAPPSILSVWEKELGNVVDGVEVVKFDKVNATDSLKILLEKGDNTSPRKLFLLSLQKSYRMGEDIKKLNKDSLSIVFDESHKIKNRAGKAGKYAAQVLSKHFKVTWLLTGTPISKNAEDLFNQMKVLGIDNPETKTVKAFTENFLVTDRQYNSKFKYEVVVGDKNKERLFDILGERSMFMKLSDSGVELPPANEEEIIIEQDKQVKKALKDRVYGSWKLHNSGSKMSAFQQSSSSFLYGEDIYGERIVETFKENRKKSALLDILDGTKDNFVIFYNFEQELEFIKSAAKESGRSFLKMSKEVEEIPEVGVLAVQYLSGSEGLNLQMYNRMIYYSPTTQGALFLQSKKRIHRIGQEKPVFYTHFLTEGTIEEKIFEKIKNGEAYTEEMFESQYKKEIG